MSLRYHPDSSMAAAIAGIRTECPTAAEFRDYVAEAVRRGGAGRGLAVCTAILEWEERQHRDGLDVGDVRRMRREAEGILQGRTGT